MPDQIVVENGLEFTGKNCRIVLWTDYVPTCGGEGAPCLPYPPQQFIIRIVLTEDDRPATLVKLEQFLCRAAEAKAEEEEQRLLEMDSATYMSHTSGGSDTYSWSKSSKGNSYHLGN